MNAIAQPPNPLCVVCRKPTSNAAQVFSSMLPVCDWCNGPLFDAWFDKHIAPKLAEKLMANAQPQAQTD